MKKIKQSFGPLQKGKVRIIIRYRETGETVTFEGMFNPDRNLDVIKKILRRRAPKPKPESLLDREAMKEEIYRRAQEAQQEASISGEQ